MDACPDDGRLEHYFAGLSGADEEGVIRAHLAQCTRCRQWISDADADELLLDDIRKHIPIEGPDDESTKVVRVSDREETEPPKSGPIPERIGQFHIKRAIASGGMGTVYEAVQEHPRRAVAVKVMKWGITSRSALRRFEQESQLLGRLRHRGIAHIYDAGTHRDGDHAVPYFAMEYIPNAKHIVAYAIEKKLGTRELLQLFCEVCDAIHHGHQKGIIHRDLKPGNILVDSSGQPKIIDFGVARSTDSDLAVTTLQTGVGQLVGTLQYMSPEQCEGDPQDIGAGSDVYALGVLLYELLCGRRPYDLTRVAVPEAVRVIREETPPKLSTINAHLRGDIETIALKAMEKDQRRRYQSASELSQDIRRYLNNEAILARPPSIGYQLRMIARRHRPVVVATAAVFVILVAALCVSAWLYVRADDALADSVEELIKQRVQNGVRLVREGDFRGAEESYRDALELDPNHWRALGSLAGLLKDRYAAQPCGEGQRRLLDKSEALVDRAIEIEGDQAGLWNVKAVVLYMLGRLDEAELACQEALDHDSGYQWAASNRARVLAMQGRLAEALDSAQSAARSTRDDAPGYLWNVGVWYTLATLQGHLGQREAFDSLEHAFACDNKDKAPWLIRARLRLQLGGNDDAAQALHDALNADDFFGAPDYRVKRVLALAHLRTGSFGEAIDNAQTAMALGDVATFDHLIIALAEAGRGRRDRARVELQAAKDKWPENIRKAGDFTATACRGILWIDSADELIRLQRETEDAIQKPDS